MAGVAGAASFGPGGIEGRGWRRRWGRPGRRGGRGAGCWGRCGLAAVKLAVHLAVAGRYGWHRDELYYAATGRHLALGYPDFPPVTPLLARLSEVLFGESLAGFRVLPALAGAVMVVLAGLAARELGGGPAAQVLAGLAALCSPMLLGANAMFQTVSFDQLAWVVVLWLFARLLRTGDRRWWLAVGAAVGVGLETKFTMLTLALGIAVGVLATPARRDLRTPWPWLGAGIALLLLAPNLAWQVGNGWPTLEFLHHQTAEVAAEESPLTFLGDTLLLAGPLALPLCLVGWWVLWSRIRFRALAWACLVPPAVVLATQAKAYYVGPLYPLLLAAGSVGVEALAARRGRPWLLKAVAAGLLVGGLVAAPIALPVLPTSRTVDLGLAGVREDWAEMLGWPELAATVAAARDRLPPSQRDRAAIVAGNYGEAGAIDRYGPRLGLPPATSGHNGYWSWAGDGRPGAPLVAVGIPVERLAGLCDGARQVATLDNPRRVPNEERGQPVVTCQSTRMPLRAWPPLRHLG
jgi:4-amino-4-deoxy-L-arabinose transferase-like glycosyltransferase